MRHLLYLMSMTTFAAPILFVAAVNQSQQAGQEVGPTSSAIAQMMPLVSQLVGGTSSSGGRQSSAGTRIPSRSEVASQFDQAQRALGIGGSSRSKGKQDDSFSWLPTNAADLRATFDAVMKAVQEGEQMPTPRAVGTPKPTDYSRLFAEENSAPTRAKATKSQRKPAKSTARSTGPRTMQNPYAKW